MENEVPELNGYGGAKGIGHRIGISWYPFAKNLHSG